MESSWITAPEVELLSIQANPRVGVGTRKTLGALGFKGFDHREAFIPSHPINTVAYAEHLGASMGYLIVFMSRMVIILCYLTGEKNPTQS